ncbi:hypothetical protein GDO78_014269 [Eleutherodactylus coqui]|uniref:Uncharacterized protein n=1 Tax=Eleutherodactylus coqui TaxID=57060 RepID=A0A8J6BF04_ELECQ|nr:hypothetical protein GDO78_014269 [Eleutherodactylus coqui]
MSVCFSLVPQSTLRPMHPQALHPTQTLLTAPPIAVPMQPTKSALAYSHPSRSASPGGYPHGTPPQQPHTVRCSGM